MPWFTSKPTVVKAEQFHMSSDPDGYPEGVEWGGDLPNGTGCYVVQSLQGVVPVQDGDWIITEPDNIRHYPCKPDIFAAKYTQLEHVEEPSLPFQLRKTP